MNIQTSQFRKKLVYLLIILSFIPFLAFFIIDSELNSLLSKLANLSGFIGAVFLIWQFLIGIRGFIKNITTDYDWAIKIHTFLGIGGGLFVLAHPILQNILVSSSYFYIFNFNFSNEYTTFVSYGRIGFALFLIVWLSSAIFRKVFTYRLWIYIHYLSYPMLFFTLIHPFKIGTLLNSNQFVLYYWYFLVLISIVAIFYKIGDILNFSFKKFQVISKTNYQGDIYTLEYKSEDKLPQITPGQYFYLKKDFFGEAHPFSVLDYSEENKTILFGIKALGKFSTKLKDTKINDFHYLDGPYGEFTIEGQNEEPKIILAGGIGITPFYKLVKDFGNEDTYLLYANFKLDYALFRDKFKQILGLNYFDFVSNEKVSGKNIVCDVISTNKIKEITSKYDLKNINFFICGSPGFTKGMINCLKELGVSKSKIFIEEFEY